MKRGRRWPSHRFSLDVPAEVPIVAGNSSFSIYPVGDSDKFSWIDLIQEDGGHISFRRAPYGTGFANAKLRANREIGNPFSQSNLKWMEAAGIEDHRRLDVPIFIERTEPMAGTECADGDRKRFRKNRDKAECREQPERIEGLEGAAIKFKLDANDRIVQARHSSGHTIRYDYAPNGKLTHIKDSETGDERYEYDQANWLTTVLDARGNAELSIAYGYLEEVTAETLADHRRLRFEYRFCDDRTLNSVTLTDDQGFTTEWTRGQDGF